jgi:arylsulfatase A-like enzyme
MHTHVRGFPSFLCAGAVLAAMCAQLPAAERNIVFFITDDQGQTLGCYGDAAAATPHVDRLAADGVLFLNAFATTASCSPSRSVVMSGLHNHANGQYGLQHDVHHFSSYHNVVSLALPQVLADAGYRTAHIGKYHVAPEAVYHFETYLRGNGRSTVELAERCRDVIFASHTFHEIQMYYPMRAVQDRQYKLIWNIASPLPFPFASDLWAASTWQAQYRQGLDAPYGHRTVREYLHRPVFELYDMAADPHEARNLAGSETHQDVLRAHQQRLRAFQQETGDPWLLKWDYG